MVGGATRHLLKDGSVEEFRGDPLVRPCPLDQGSNVEEIVFKGGSPERLRCERIQEVS